MTMTSDSSRWLPIVDWVTTVFCMNSLRVSHGAKSSAYSVNLGLRHSLLRTQHLICHRHRQRCQACTRSFLPAGRWDQGALNRHSESRLLAIFFSTPFLFFFFSFLGERSVPGGERKNVGPTWNFWLCYYFSLVSRHRLV
jgi:hypothetical protein